MIQQFQNILIMDVVLDVVLNIDMIFVELHIYFDHIYFLQ